MANKPFRVLLDLTDLHIQSFKYVWINVCPHEIKTISEFKLSLLRKIKLDYKDIKLFVRGGLLLDEETIIILREDDTVKVQFNDEAFPPQGLAIYSTKQHGKSSKKNVTEEYNQDYCPSTSKSNKKHIFSASNKEYDQVTSVKKKKKQKLNSSLQDEYEEINSKIPSCDDRSTVPSYKKKKKSVVSDETNLLSNTKILDSSTLFETKNSMTKINVDLSCKGDANDELNDSLNSKTKNKKSFVNDLSVTMKEERKPNQELQETNTETVSNSNADLIKPIKKKRKRYRKRKKPLESTLEEDNFESEFKPFNIVETACAKRKHIIFTSQEPNEIICQENAEVIILDDNDNADGTNLSIPTYVVSEKLNNNDQLQADYPKISTPTQGNDYADLKCDLTLIQTKNSNFTKNKTLPLQKSYESNMCYENETKSPIYSEEKEISQTKTFEDFPPLSSLPEIGTHIAYKIIELNENYNPVISKFKEGIVRYIDPLTEEMEIEFLKHEIRPGRTGKFENLKDDEFPPPEILKYETVEWSSLIEPKLLPSCPTE